MKKLSKIEKEEAKVRLNDLYRELHEYSKSPSVTICKTIAGRIRERKYTERTIRGFLSTVKWFIETYGTTYRCDIRFLLKDHVMDIYDPNGNRFIILGFSINGPIIHEDDVNLFKSCLEKDGLYDERIHHIPESLIILNKLRHPDAS